VDHCCSSRVYWGSCCSICRCVCSVLWTIVVHLVFIGTPGAQSVDLCGVLWTIVNGPQNTTQIYRLSNRNPNKHGVNNNGPQNTTQIYRLSNMKIVWWFVDHCCSPRVYWDSCCSFCRFVDHCCLPRVYWGSCCSICRFVCSVLWTIVVHPCSRGEQQ
jgi:hypothetical protein